MAGTVVVGTGGAGALLLALAGSGEPSDFGTPAQASTVPCNEWSLSGSWTPRPDVMRRGFAVHVRVIPMSPLRKLLWAPFLRERFEGAARGSGRLPRQGGAWRH